MSRPYLWVDDVRIPPDYYAVTKKWDVARDYQEAIDLLEKNTYEVISLDHDMGYGPTGLDVLKFMEKKGIWPNEIVVHSENPVGKEAMKNFISDHEEGKHHDF